MGPAGRSSNIYNGNMKASNSPRDAAAAARRYHHGDLHATLLRLALDMLEQHGVEGLTLRALAREAGISHAAPKNHFDDLTGLLSEVAAVGYARLADALEEAAAGAPDDPRLRLVALGHAYVARAHAQPGLFRLMFRDACLDFQRPALRDASARSRSVMLDALGDGPRGEGGRPAGVDGSPPGAGSGVGLEVALVAAWSLVHGYAVLLTDGRLDRALADTGMGWEAMLDGVFASLR